jgi:predicted TIM-barrel fold metal-dependent hydrolase
VRNGLLVADAHTHIFPKQTRLYGREVIFTVEALLASMDLYGIDFSVVIARPTQQLNVGDLRALHDSIAAAVATAPGRLAAFCWATPRLGSAGVVEVRRCLSELGYVGMELHGDLEQFNIDDEEVRPLARLASERGVPVSVHTQLAVRGCEPWRLVPLAEDFPDVRFVMGHLGADGGMLQSLAAAKIASRVPNIAVEVSTTVTDPWATFSGPAEILGPERVLFGSDAPLHQPALNLLKMDLLEMPIEWRRAMIGGNVAAMLGASVKIESQQRATVRVGKGEMK